MTDTAQLRAALDELSGYATLDSPTGRIALDAARVLLTIREAGALIITPDEKMVERIAVAIHDAHNPEHSLADCSYEPGKQRISISAVAVLDALRDAKPDGETR